eukprot:CAMPEP_0113482690 /NCGR_PEP_ID=MMETSP0014_2-20120614/23052_1 /TAXON_ID=2857 /ORGANISM="Nitzschia sp." /LENGTH=814 /DNA_ID=CAMNT_0000376221 /DNA_START=106 /DNA_END=2550 /DNA_ORIENTATION=+ /assembly_acc=CAM_ASM_000159
MNQYLTENNSSNFIDNTNNTASIKDMISGDRTQQATNDVAMVATSLTDFERPAKKIRPGPSSPMMTMTAAAAATATAAVTASAIDSVLILNEIAIANYNSGDHSKAEQFFSQALRRVDFCSSSSSSSSSCSSSSSNSNNNTTPFSQKQGKQQLCLQFGTTKSSVTDIITSDIGDSDNATATAAFTSTTTTTTTNSTASTSRITEYDENMYMYRTPLAVGTNDMTARNKDCVVSTLYYNMGQIHITQGLYDDAAMWFTRAMDVLSGVVGFYPSSSLLAVKTLHCLGYCSYRGGDDNQSLNFYQKALEVVSEATNSGETIGPVHLAIAFNCVGVMYFNKPENGTELAMDMFLQSFRLYESIKDITSPESTKSIATVLNNIGRVQYLRSEFGDALSFYMQSLNLRREVLGHNSVDVAATMYNIGQTYHQLKQFGNSLQHYKEFLRIATDGSEMISLKDVALVYKSIAEIYHEQSKLSDALEYFTKALKAQSVDDVMSTDIATTLNKLGNLCYQMRDFKAAMEYYRQGLEVERRVLPANHPHTIITLTNIAHIHKQLGEHRQALAAYQAVGKMQLPAFGSESLNVAETLSSVGLMQYHLRDYESSFESYQEALRIRRQCHGTDEHTDIASTLNSIGLVLFKQDQFDLAKQCFSESLRIRTKLLGKDHRDVAILWYNTATVMFEQGQDSEAIEMYKETLRVERAALGPTHSDVVLTLQHLGQVYQQLGRIEKSLEYFQEALAIERRRQDSQKKASSVGRILNLIGNVFLQLGRTEEMMDCYVEASRLYESNTNVQETLVIAGYNHYGLSKTNPPCAPVA